MWASGSPFSDHSYISGEKGGDEGQGKACHHDSHKINVHGTSECYDEMQNELKFSLKILLSTAK